MSALVLRGRSGFPRIGTLTLIGAFFVLSVGVSARPRCRCRAGSAGR